MARRLAALEAALSPTELVCRWLDEAHTFDDLASYTGWLLDEPEDAHPADRLLREASEGVRSRLGRRTPEALEEAVRKALRETLFRFELVLRINVLAHDTIERESLVQTIFALQFSTLVESKRSEAVDTRLVELRRLVDGRVHHLDALAAARDEVEARYLAGHPALFPAERRRWTDVRTATATLADLAARIGELDGWGPTRDGGPGTPDADVSGFVADLVEPAKVAALEKLGEGRHAFGIATRWLRPKLSADT